MRTWLVAATIGALLAFPAGAPAQDPFWKLIRPNATFDNHWRVEPRPAALFSVLDEPIYYSRRPVLTGDRASATRPGQRFAIGFSDIGPEVERFNGGELWIYIGIQKRTRVDFAVRTRRAGRVVTVSFMNRVSPPITIEPENPPVGRNGFRDWLPMSIPPMPREEANRLSLVIRISPSSPKHSLSRVYAAFAELYPEGS